MESRADVSTEITNNQQLGPVVLGPDVLFAIFNWLKLSDIYAFLATNKQLYTLYESDEFWQKKFGAVDHLDFICRLIVLDKDLQASIIAATIKIADGEMTQQLLNITHVERVAILVPPNERLPDKKWEQADFLSDKRMVIALREGSITWEKAYSSRACYRKIAALDGGLNYLRDNFFREWLLRNWGVISRKGLMVIRDKLLSLEQIEKLHGKHGNGNLDKLLHSANGLLALREGLITAEQVQCFPRDYYGNLFGRLLSDDGIEALRQKRVTPEWVAALPEPYDALENILEDIRFQSLRKLVKDRLGDRFSFSVMEAENLRNSSIITAYLPKQHPAVQEAYRELTAAFGMSPLETVVICGCYTGIMIRHHGVHHLRQTLKNIPKLKSLPELKVDQIELLTRSATAKRYLENDLASNMPISLYFKPADYNAILNDMLTTALEEEKVCAATNTTEVGFEVFGLAPLLIICNYLTLPEAYAWLSTSKQLYTVFLLNNLWQEKFGASDRSSFMRRLIVLDKELQRSVIAANIKITEGERTQYFLNMPAAERVPHFLSTEESKSLLNPAAFLNNQQFIIAVREGLVTSRQVLHNSQYRKFFALTNGLQYLRDKPFREWLLKYPVVISENGLTAIREKLLSLTQIEKLHVKFGDTNLSVLLSDNGLTALRERLITAEQALCFPCDGRLTMLLSDEGLEVLRQKEVTPESAATKSQMELVHILENMQVKCLKKLVKDRLGDKFSYEETRQEIVGFNKFICHSEITVFLKQNHPVVQAAYEKLERPHFTMTKKEKCGYYTVITITHTEKNQLKEALTAMPKAEPLPPPSVEPVAFAPYHPGLIRTVSRFTLFPPLLTSMNINTLGEALEGFLTVESVLVDGTNPDHEERVRATKQ